MVEKGLIADDGIFVGTEVVEAGGKKIIHPAQGFFSGGGVIKRGFSRVVGKMGLNVGGGFEVEGIGGLEFELGWFRFGRVPLSVVGIE